MLTIPSKLPQTGSSIFARMSALAQKHKAINLSQGMPDLDLDLKLTELVSEGITRGFNQYAPMPGYLPLRQQIAEKVERLHQAQYHPETEITITAGATQALFTAITALVQPNDEVIIFEPAYDCYAPAVRLCGGLVKYFQLEPPDFAIDWSQLRKLVSVRTRLIIINSPHNPTGAMISEEDLAELVRLTKKSDMFILSDEVYEHITFDGRKHLSLAAVPELRERTMVVASFGKLFHTTGWKLGYCLAPEKLTSEIRKVHQFLVFSVNSVMQYAAAEYLNDPEVYRQLSPLFEEKRDRFSRLMEGSAFQLLPCQGSYFQLADYSSISEENDNDFCERMITEVGVAAIPVSAFYSKGTDHKLVRFCFAKKDDTLEQAAERLKKMK